MAVPAASLFEWVSKMAGNLLLPLFFRVMALLGIGSFLMIGMDLLIDQFYLAVGNSMGGIPASTVALLGIAGLDHYLTAIMSAHLAVFTINKSASFLAVK